jgi:uncharacterized transporter YbjL
MRFSLRTLLIDFLTQHWLGFLLLLPFLLLLAIHNAIGVSDSMWLDTTNPGPFFFNCMLIITFIATVGAYVAQTVVAAIRRGGWAWVAAKLVVLVIYWTAIVTIR